MSLMKDHHNHLYYHNYFLVHFILVGSRLQGNSFLMIWFMYSYTISHASVLYDSIIYIFIDKNIKEFK